MFDAGAKLLAILLADFAGVNAFNLLWILAAPLLKQRCSALQCVPNWAEFSVGLACFSLLYRMLVICLGSMLLPLIAPLGAVLFVLQWLLERHVLIPRAKYAPVDLGMRTVLVGCATVSALYLLAFPVGSLWLVFAPGKLPAAYRNCSVIITGS